MASGGLRVPGGWETTSVSEVALSGETSLLYTLRGATPSPSDLHIFTDCHATLLLFDCLVSSLFHSLDHCMIVTSHIIHKAEEYRTGSVYSLRQNELCA